MSPTIDDLAAGLVGPHGKTVLVRSDLNAPIHDGVITDDGRIHASLPTIARLADKGACRRDGSPRQAGRESQCEVLAASGGAADE